MLFDIDLQSCHQCGLQKAGTLIRSNGSRIPQVQRTGPGKCRGTIDDLVDRDSLPVSRVFQGHALMLSTAELWIRFWTCRTLDGIMANGIMAQSKQMEF